MKVFLLQPPVEDFYDTTVRLQPLGLCYLKAALQAHCPGVTVTVRDFHHGCGRRTIPVPAELQYLREYFTGPNQSPFSTFHQYYHFGAEYEEIADKVAAAAPDLVGISALFSPYYREVLNCAAAIRNRSRAPIVIGGGQATCAPELMLDSPAVDFVILGEGERPLVELVQALGSGGDFSRIAGLGFKANGEMRCNPPADNYPFTELPSPDLSDLDSSQYLYENQPITFIQSSRGCPHRCTFCSVHRLFGRRYRRRRPEQIVAEMEDRYQQGYRVFDFEDDNLTWDRNGITSLCDLIIRNFAGRPLKLLAMNGISYQGLDREILAKMRQAGFSRLNLALVSSDQQLLNALDRGHDAGRLAEIITLAAGLGFDLEVHLIIGLPDDTLENMIGSMVFLAGLPVLIGASIFYLTPGTAIAADFPAMTPADIFRSRSTAMAIVSEQCRRDHLFTLFTTARILNFVKGIAFNEPGRPLSALIEEGAGEHDRSGIGFMVLKKLLQEKELVAYSHGICKPIPRFDYPLFSRIWQAAATICTQKGNHVVLEL